jgi:hypothetical protein
LTPRVETRDILQEDVRPRSPAHETSIIVPDVSSWRKKTQTSESDSETESDTSTESSDDSVEKAADPPLVVPPRVEITEVLDKDGAETELSDWAHEENSLEMDVQVEARNITVRRPKRVVALAEEDDLSELEKVDIITVTETKETDKIAEVEPEVETPTIPDVQPDDESPKSIVVDVMTLSVSSIGEGIEDIDFADTSDEDEGDSQHLDEPSSKYQPLAAASSSTTTTTTESVQSSELSKSAPIETPLDTPDTDMEKLLHEEVGYEAHVRRLQDRVSPFGNAKDSIDVRKGRRSSTSSTTSSPSKVWLSWPNFNT